MRIVLKDNIGQVIRDMDKGVDALARGNVIAMYRAMTVLEAQIKQNIRSKSGLKVRSGSLLNSVQKDVTIQDNNVIGRVGPENIVYAAIHEYGGIIPARKIEPRNAKALSWMGPEGRIFSKGHMLPETKIPARPYLQPAFEDKMEYIREQFKLNIQKVFG